jgi:hypothetical protein
MIRFHLLALPILAALAAGTATAQTSATPPPVPAPPAPTALSGITIAAPAKTPPKVVSTFPAQDQTVTPGALILRITFDQKMSPDGWDYAKGAERYPQCLARPRLLNDEKTFVLLCTAGGDGKFSVAFNAGAGGGFSNLAGQRATPSSLDFATSKAESLATIEDAMKAAGLKKDEGPVMDKAPAAMASVSAPPAAP